MGLKKDRAVKAMTNKDKIFKSNKRKRENHTDIKSLRDKKFTTHIIRMEKENLRRNNIYKENEE